MNRQPVETEQLVYYYNKQFRLLSKTIYNIDECMMKMVHWPFAKVMNNK